MQHKIHMHDQVRNKVEDIMNHYKRRPMSDFMRVVKQLVRQPDVSARFRIHS